MDITKLGEGPGVFIIQTDTVPLVENYNTLIHIVNLTQYETAYLTLKHLINQVPWSLQINVTLNRVERELALFTNKRTKRGLLNAIGRTINFVTGNMDDEDAQEIRNRLSTLEANQNNIADYSNNLFKVNNAINSELSNINQHINNQSKEIMSYSRTLSNTISRIDNELQTKILEDRLLNSIQILLDHIIELKQAIAFARAGIVSSHLLSPDELTNITLEQFELMKMALLHNKKNNDLYFVVRIPTMTKKPCHKIEFIPVPNYKNSFELDYDTESSFISCESQIFINKGSEKKTEETN